jgi:hypothetical protein
MSRGTGFKVYKDSDWGEYAVVFYRNGERLTDATYFTDCAVDAIETGEHWAAGEAAAEIPLSFR